jgi:hypothetical protein
MSIGNMRWTVGVMAALALTAAEARAQFRSFRAGAVGQSVGLRNVAAGFGNRPASNFAGNGAGLLALGFLSDGGALSCSPGRDSFYPSLAYRPSVGYGPYPYGGPAPEDSYGGYLRGNADTISAEGQFRISQQRTHLLRATVRMQQVDTRRRVFDEWLYERANTPTVEDQRELTQQHELRRSQNDPPMTEIHSAKALNDLLLDLQKRWTQGRRLDPIRLDEDVVGRINVSPGHGGHVGVLRDGRLHWPTALSGDAYQAEREQLSTLAIRAIHQATDEVVEPAVLREMTRTLDRLQKDLSQRAADLPPANYREARRFLGDFGAALTALRQPDAQRYFTGKYVARGKTVSDLVEHMTQQGLRFAPAVAGDEAAYLALHRALAACDTAAQTQIVAQR